MMRTRSLNYQIILGFIFLVNCSGQTEMGNPVGLWPEIEPFETGWLQVSDIHEIYYELSGNPKGKPVFLIHGGPGGGCTPYMRRFFNPEKYLIVMHDQRGCGKSIPNAELQENTTHNLIEDIEQLRQKLKLNKILLFGGSWGSTLSIAYGERYPERVSGMILRGIFLCSDEEAENIMIQVVPKFFPETFDLLVEEFPDYSVTYTPVHWVERLQTEDPEDLKRNAKLYSRYGYKASGLLIEDEMLDKFYDADENFTEIHTMALLESYYLSNPT